MGLITTIRQHKVPSTNDMAPSIVVIDHNQQKTEIFFLQLSDAEFAFEQLKEGFGVAEIILNKYEQE